MATFWSPLPLVDSMQRPNQCMADFIAPNPTCNRSTRWGQAEPSG